MKTYWVDQNGGTSSSKSVDSNVVLANDIEECLIGWMSELFEKQICTVIGMRMAKKSSNSVRMPTGTDVLWTTSAAPGYVLDEVAAVIDLPLCTNCNNLNALNAAPTLNEIERFELRKFITLIASMYQSNPFHNFDHAVHVTMSVVKFFNQIPTSKNGNDHFDQEKTVSSIKQEVSIQDNMNGLVSDPLTLVACMFAALVHDVQHPGISNIQLASPRYYIEKC